MTYVGRSKLFMFTYNNTIENFHMYRTKIWTKNLTSKKITKRSECKFNLMT